MAARRVSSKLILAFIDVGVVLGMILGYRNYNVDRLSLFTIGFLSLLVLNGMFLLIRKTEPDLPPTREANEQMGGLADRVACGTGCFG